MKRLLIDYALKKPLAALMDDERLVEMFPMSGVTRTGEIYAGIIKNVLPRQSLFIDIGLEKNAFLDLSDARERRLFADGKLCALPGQALTVQVLKDPRDGKGALVTSQISCAGARLVLTGSPGGVSVSRRVTDPDEHAQLKKIGESVLPGGFSLIMRTVCAGKGEEEIKRELESLIKLYGDILERARYAAPPCAVYAEDPAGRVLKDLAAEGIERIIVNGAPDPRKLRQTACDMGFGGAAFEIYAGGMPLFDAYGVSRQAEKALMTKVWLNCGGWITVERTEACVVIDVNTGKYTAGKGREKAALKVNLEAAAEAARQLRLRNLSGIIIIDFIDLREEEDKQTLCGRFREELAKDRISASMVGMTELHLMQVTRKKAGLSLAELLSV